MKNLICFMCLCVGLAVAARQTVFATPQNNYKTYANARFKYSISYPADLLIPQGEAENGDGQAATTFAPASADVPHGALPDLCGDQRALRVERPGGAGRFGGDGRDVDGDLHPAIAAS